MPDRNVSWSTRAGLAARRLVPRAPRYAVRAGRMGLDMFLYGFEGRSRKESRQLLAALQHVSDNVPCGHDEDEMLRVVHAIVFSPEEIPGIVVSCGCWKGGSAAKLSLAARSAGRTLTVFDSFQGLPDHEEAVGRTIYAVPTAPWRLRSFYGAAVRFHAGEYQAGVEEVTNNVRRFGDLSVTTLVPGWFDDTLPEFDDQVCVAYIDVDLVSSTMTCLKYLWPRLSEGGIIFSQDGHLTAVVEAMENPAWWAENFHRHPPRVFGAGTSKLVFITK